MRLLLAAITATSLLFASGSLFAEPSTTASAHMKKSTSVTTDTAASGKIRELGNTKCPITGQPVGSMQEGAHVDVNGVRIGLCCDGCAGAVKKEPEKYIKKAEASVPKKK